VIRHLFLGYRGLSRPASVFSMMMMMMMLPYLTLPYVRSRYESYLFIFYDAVLESESTNPDGVMTESRCLCFAISR